MQHFDKIFRSIGSYLCLLLLSANMSQGQTLQRYLSDCGGASYSATGRTSDGGVFAYFMCPTHMLLRYNDQLEPIWSREMSGGGTAGPDVDGGVFMLQWVYTDTTTLAMILDRFDAAGIMTWSRSVLIPEVPSWPGNAWVKRILSDGSGGIWGVASFYPEGSYLFKLDSVGEALWNRSVPGVFLHDLTPDGEGGCYAVGEQPGEGGYVVCRTDAEGNVLFNDHYFFDEAIAQRYQVENTGNGAAVILGHDDGIDLTVFSDTGEPLTMHRYVPTRPEGCTAQFRVAGGQRTSSGDHLFASSFTGIPGAAVLFRTDETGEVTEAHGFLNSLEPYRYHSFGSTASFEEDIVVFGRGDLSYETGGHVGVDMVWKLSPPYTDACQEAPFEVSTTTVPVASIQVQQVNGSLQSIITSSAVQHLPDQGSLPRVFDQCEPITVDIEEISSNTQAIFEVRGGVHSAGEPLRLVVRTACELQLLDPLGRELGGVPTLVQEGEATFGMSNRASGIFLLKGRTFDGRAHCVRFVVD